MRTSIALMFALLLIAGHASAAAPTVSNVVAVQRTDGSGLVDVNFDLADADGDVLYVSISASHDDGATWAVPCRSLTGDAGSGIAAQAGRTAVWNFAADNAELEFEACRVQVIASDNGVAWDTDGPSAPVIHAWEAIDWDDARRLEEMARTDLLIITGMNIWGSPVYNDVDVLQRIRDINPDIKIIAYVLAKGVDDRGNVSSNTFQSSVYYETMPYWAYTTTGDTLSDWNHRITVNLLYPECRDIMVGKIVEYQRNSANHFDGVFWDYFNNAIWVPDWLPVEGEPDLDGDGIPMNQDADERLAYQAACVDMITAMRDSLGDGFLQIFNGQRAYADSTFAALSDGLNYEYFPDVFFPQPQTMRDALGFDYPFNVFRTANWPRTNNGGPYNILENLQKSFYVSSVDGLVHQLVYGKLMRVAALLTDSRFTFNGHIYGWPVNPINLGPALGPATETPDGLHRDFRFGAVDLVWRTGDMPMPFDYTIRLNGRIIEEMNIPYEFPVTPEFP